MSAVPPSDAGVVVDVRGLLTIDVDAELRKLATAQLQGPRQVPAELVRRALAAGAGRVEVELARGRAVIRDDGDGPPDAHLRALAHLLDPQTPARARHDALLALEAAGALALLALAGLDLDHLEITRERPGHPAAALTYRRGQRPRLDHAPPGAAAPSRPRAAVTLHGPGLDPARARAHLAAAARFAPARVEVDGAPVADGLADYLTHAPCSFELAGGPPLRGQIALPRARGPARLWLLQHGLVATHMTLAQAPTFEAVELGERASPRATPADLRDRVAPLLGPLADAGVELMLALAPRLDPAGAAQAHLLALLLDAARLGRQRPAIEAAAILPVLLAPGEPLQLRSIADLRAAAADAGPGGGPTVLALDPDDPPEGALLGGAPAAILDAAARSALAELFGLRLRLPPRRAPERRARLRALGERLRALPARLLALGGAPLPDGALRPDERELLAHLRAILPQSGPDAPLEVALCRGRGRPRRAGPRLLLPRDAPEVRAAALALARGPAWLYPAALALLGGALPPVGVRTTWLREWARPPRR